MKRRVRGACAALSALLLLGCALGAAAAGLRCWALGAGLRGEPFRLGAGGAFYSGLLLGAGGALLGAGLLCGRRTGRAGPLPPAPRGRHNLLLLGALVCLLGVLSAFAGAVVDGDSVALAARKYAHFCRPRPGPRASPAQCGRLQDYRRGLLLSAVLNALECPLGLLSLLLLRSYRAAPRRSRAPGSRAHARARTPGSRARRARRGRGRARTRGRRRPSQASILAPEDSDPGAPGPCGAVSFIRVGAGPRGAAAGVEVSCGGHPSVELPGYAPADPELDAPYPYCCRPRELDPAR